MISNSTKMDGKSLDLENENVETIRSIFPDAFIEGKISFDKLKLLLGGKVDFTDEKYNFSWSGKNNSIRISQKPSTGTLRPCMERSINWGKTRNIFIEGDNLEVLKLLQKGLFGTIDVIYIDPPYNTGKDFVYKDNYADNIQNYLNSTKQIDEYGNFVSTNTESDGRYHSNWLSMMYSRLKLARNILSDSGSIYISISDVEQHNLRKICDEIFGSNNFIANLVWTNKEGGGSSDSKYYKIKHEYILCYAKNAGRLSINNEAIEDQDRYRLSDEYVATRGNYQLVKLSSASIQYSQSLDYPIVAPDGSQIMPVDNSDKDRSCWRWSKSKLEWGIKNDFVVIKKDKNEQWQVYTKQYTNCDNPTFSLI